MVILYALQLGSIGDPDSNVRARCYVLVEPFRKVVKALSLRFDHLLLQMAQFFRVINSSVSIKDLCKLFVPYAKTCKVVDYIAELV